MGTAVLHLRSLGQLTADVQRPYAALARAVDELGVAPALTIDGVAYYDLAAVARITAEAARHGPRQPAPRAPRRVPSPDPAADAAATPAAPRGPRPPSRDNPRATSSPGHPKET